MGRPGLALGTAGKIRLHATPSGHRAVAWYRDYDGKCRQVERHAKTKAAAEAALRLALRDRARFDAGGDINPNTRVNVLAEAWFAGLKNNLVRGETTEQGCPSRRLERGRTGRRAGVLCSARWLARPLQHPGGPTSRLLQGWLRPHHQPCPSQ